MHKMPLDLKSALHSDPEAMENWKKITRIAKNEWICWIISVKKDKTRKEHIKRTVNELKEGMRRPCCWGGCPHRV